MISLVDVAERRAYPLAVKQTVRSEADKKALKERKKKRAKKSKTCFYLNRSGPANIRNLGVFSSKFIFL